MWYGNVIPDGMGIPWHYTMEIKPYHTMWDHTIPGHTMEMEPYHTMWNHTMPGHTMEMEPYHTMWNHTIPGHTMEVESWSHTIPSEWNLCRIAPKVGQVS